MKRDLGLGVCGLLGWLAATAGCSLIAVTGPTSSQKPRVDVACTVDGYAPAIDLAWASGGILGALTGYNSLEDSKGLVLLVSGAYLASGLYGLHTTGKCAKAKNAAYAYHAKLLGAQTEPPTPIAPPASFRPKPPDGEDEEPEVKTKPQSAPRPAPLEGDPN